MQPYELTMILQPSLDEGRREQVVDRIRKMIQATKGDVRTVDHWGKRALAYPIQHVREGLYVAMDVSLSPSSIREVEQSLSHDAAVLRSLLATAAKKERPKFKKARRKVLVKKGSAKNS